MSIGNNTTDFRIYKTSTAARHWTIQFTNETANAFYDCFAFWTPKRGITQSDSVNGIFPDIRTTDGMTWQSIAANMPRHCPGKPHFLPVEPASLPREERNAWITTGGSAMARILATRDGGDTWNAYDTPLVSSPSAGGFRWLSATRGMGSWVAATWPQMISADAATSDDGGRTWTLTKKPPVQGAIFCLAYARGIRHRNEDGEEAEQERDQTVVITAETAPNFSTRISGLDSR